jgi:hypothetical protein
MILKDKVRQTFFVWECSPNNSRSNRSYHSARPADKLKSDVLRTILDERSRSLILENSVAGRAAEGTPTLLGPPLSFVDLTLHFCPATFWHDQKHSARALQRYNQLMDSAEMRAQRAYRDDNYSWTEEDLEKYEEAFQIYGHGPRSNRLIAEYIGNGKLMFPNRLADPLVLSPFSMV